VTYFEPSWRHKNKGLSCPLSFNAFTWGEPFKFLDEQYHPKTGVLGFIHQGHIQDLPKEMDHGQRAARTHKGIWGKPQAGFRGPWLRLGGKAL